MPSSESLSTDNLAALIYYLKLAGPLILTAAMMLISLVWAIWHAAKSYIDRSRWIMGWNSIGLDCFGDFLPIPDPPRWMDLHEQILFRDGQRMALRAQRRRLEIKISLIGKGDAQ